MSYYLIKVKMGHVGRNKYLPMILPIKADSIQDAIIKARSHGGVKRDHKDWCLEKPIEVSREEYLLQEALTYNDLYWINKTKKMKDLFEDRLVDEPNYHRIGDIKSNRIEVNKLKDKSSILYKLKKMTVMIERGRIKYDKGLNKYVQIN
ncbi:hypothetical protein [Paracholeplasma manati]|uniref:hypothetical protein n=1 Tax=Paracholeplasma manati TaxID=591373 RepID=UPI002407ED52|nr:hypothetical protein [Paracholeplasma manati]